MGAPTSRADLIRLIADCFDAQPSTLGDRSAVLKATRILDAIEGSGCVVVSKEEERVKPLA